MGNNRMEEALGSGFTQPPASYGSLNHEEKGQAAQAMFDTLMKGETFHGSQFQTAQEECYDIEEVFANADIERYHETLKMLLLADTQEKLAAARNKMAVVTAGECDDFCNSIVFDK